MRERVPVPGGYVINVGTYDGRDVCDALFGAGCDGLCVEPVHVEAARRYVAGLPGDVRLDTRFATPDNIADVLAGCPEKVHLLKIDIDGYDLDLLRAVWAAGLRPEVVVLEYNETIPPPIRYEVPYVPGYRHGDVWPPGCSIASAQDAFDAAGYEIVDLAEAGQPNNVVAVAGNAAGGGGNAAGGAGVRLWERLYGRNRDRLLDFPWNAAVDHWAGDPVACAADLRVARTNRALGLALPMSHDAGPRMRDPSFEAFLEDLVAGLAGPAGPGGSPTIAEVALWGRGGFARAALCAAARRGVGRVRVYRVDGAGDTTDGLERAFADLVGFAATVHPLRGRVVPGVPVPKPPSDPDGLRRYATNYAATFGPPYVALPPVDLAFLDVLDPAWFGDHVDAIDARYLVFAKHLLPRLGGGWAVEHVGESFACVRRRPESRAP